MLVWVKLGLDISSSIPAQHGSFAHGLSLRRTLARNFQLALNDLELVSTNLYAGTGEPWAGQKRAIVLEYFLIKLEIVLSAENFGADPPMGSNK